MLNIFAKHWTTNCQILLKYHYFSMPPDHIWFMLSWVRLCLIWPITDGLACSMFLFPQCQSHNPSLRLEPQACSIIYSVFAWLWMCEQVCSCGYTAMYCNGEKHFCNSKCVKNIICAWYSLWHLHLFICLCSHQVPRNIVKQLVRESCNWRSIKARIFSFHMGCFTRNRVN